MKQRIHTNALAAALECGDSAPLWIDWPRRASAQSKAPSSRRTPKWIIALALLLLCAAPAFANKVKYQYDGAGRLIAADYGSGKIATYTYDANGNILRQFVGAANTADVAIAKTSDVTGITVGNTFNYIITARNIGPDPATDVTVVDSIPFGVVLQNAATSQGELTVSGRTVIVNLGILPMNTTGTINLAAFHGFTGSFINVATVFAPQTESNTNNNEAMRTTSGLGPVTDSDSDGMPNWWETLHGLSTLSGSGANGAAGNPDGDAFTNIEEWIADTPPNDPNSFFEIDFIQRMSPIMFQFHSSPIRLYNVDYTHDLVPGVWDPLENDIEGTGAMITIVDPTGDTNRHYRVRVRIP